MATFATALETIIVYTPLGIRFWDMVRDVAVNDGLVVAARPQMGRGQAVRAYPTISGVYAFHGLPGMRALEHPAESSVLATPPLSPTRFIVEVTDTQQRFLPVVFQVDVPHQGIFPGSGSPPGNGPAGFYLFSAPTRTAAADMAMVRAQLETEAQQPAAYAVLEVTTPDGRVWYGVADERGRIAVMFPYPAFSVRPVNAPALSSAEALEPQHWSLALRVRFEPAALIQPPDGGTAAVPYLSSIFSQAAGMLRPSRAGSPVSEMAADLVFGRELVVRTDQEPVLLVG
jgi:hypothetical protein